MSKKSWLMMLVAASVLVLVAACGSGGTAEQVQVETGTKVAEGGEPPPPPDLDVLPGKGGGGGGGGGDKEKAAQEEPPTDEALAELKTKWKFGLLPADEGPPSKGQINKLMFSDVGAMLGLASGETTGKNIREFSIEVSKKIDNVVEKRTIRATLGANKKITWRLEPPETPLVPRDPLSELQLPEEFFWNSTAIDVVYEDGKTGVVEKVHIDWEGNE